MPYIKKDLRARVDYAIERICDEMPHYDVGTINYVITTLVCKKMQPLGGWNYRNISAALAVLRDVEAEMRRRLLDSYEDEKIKENGDLQVYEQTS